MKTAILTIFLLTISVKGISQYKFIDESKWKYAYEMIDQANQGNCNIAYAMFDSLTQDKDFKHVGSFFTIAKCLQKEGKTKEADSLSAIAIKNGNLRKIVENDSLLTHPNLKERLVLMYLEDQGRWSINDEFIIDSEARESILRTGVNLTALEKRIRRLPGIELHKLHVEELEKIISEYGFPTRTMVGYHGMQAVKLVILHSRLETLEKYQKEFRDRFGMRRMAYLIDKQRVAKGLQQLYGTQGSDGENGLISFYPIEDEMNVNQRRMSAGMEPIEYYAKGLGINNYKVPVHNNR